MVVKKFVKKGVACRYVVNVATAARLAHRELPVHGALGAYKQTRDKSRSATHAEHAPHILDFSFI